VSSSWPCWVYVCILIFCLFACCIPTLHNTSAVCPGVTGGSHTQHVCYVPLSVLGALEERCKCDADREEAKEKFQNVEGKERGKRVPASSFVFVTRLIGPVSDASRRVLLISHPPLPPSGSWVYQLFIHCHIHYMCLCNSVHLVT